MSALRRQLAARPPGSARVGWKVGRGERERIGGDIVVGTLTSATLLDPGSTYPTGAASLHADAEVVLEIGEDDSIVGYGVALELVDLTEGDEAEEIVAANVFHRAVAFGRTTASAPNGAAGALAVNGERRAGEVVKEEFGSTVQRIAEILAAVDERLQPGDRVITGSIVQVPVAAGDFVRAEIAGVGGVEVALA